MRKIALATFLALAFFVVSAKAQFDVSLSWTASSTSGVTYNVYRQQACSGNFQEISTGTATTTYIDSAVASGETYCYYVTAISAGIESMPSNSQATTIPEKSALPSSGAQPAGKDSCARRGTFIDWLKCVASLPHKGN